jgi:hypothetical protein
MFRKYLFATLAVLSLVLSLISCTEECQHVDADDDYLCDSCGEHFDDGDNEQPGPATLSVTFTVKFENGKAASGVQFVLTRGEKTVSLTSGSDGSVKADLEPGAYYIDVNHDTLPEYCTTDIFAIKVEEGKTDINITIIDNTPDGSLEKPFFISENETELTLAAGSETYYRIHVSTVRYITVASSDVVITCGDQVSQLVDGVATLVVSASDNDISDCVFSLKNNSAEDVDVTLGVKAPLGSYENPTPVSESGASTTVNCDTMVYYKWVATADGMLTLTANSDRNSIYIRRVLENDVPIDQYPNGQLVTTIEVAEGDVITIGVSALEANADHENQEYDVESSFTLSLE